jgi:3-hydroxyisobutyrate dehydrogenase-like beta-hydroxyacid dehydrogenase
MGKPMAMNMLKSGSELIISSRRAAHFPEFEQRGARTTMDLSEFSEAKIIFLRLPDGRVVQDFLRGEKGLLHHFSTGQIIVDFSTISYTATMEIAKRLNERAIDFFDAPVS